MTDTKRTVTCPACDKEMTKIYLKNTDINVDICLDGCGGILFDNRELEKVDEQDENADEIFEAVKGRHFESVPHEELRICTICGSPMVKQGSGYGDVEIDVCNTCGAKFLDNGELEKIRELSQNKYQYQAEVNAKIDAAELENKYIPGGRYGVFANTHFKSLGARDLAEDIVRKFLENR